MRIFIYLLFFISGICHAQSIEDIILPEFCNCFTENEVHTTEEIDMDLFTTCFDSAFKKNEAAIEELLMKTKDSTSFESQYERGYKMGQQLFGNIQEPLINQCDSYYTYVSKLSPFILKSIQKTSSQENIDTLTKQIDSTDQNIALIGERGTNKMGLLDFKSAEADFNICLNEDPSFPPALFFLAFLHDINGDSEKAIVLYENLLNQDQDLKSIGDVSKIFLAFNKRKIKEKNKTPKAKN